MKLDILQYVPQLLFMPTSNIFASEAHYRCYLAPGKARLLHPPFILERGLEEKFHGRARR